MFYRKGYFAKSRHSKEVSTDKIRKWAGVGHSAKFRRVGLVIF